MIDYHHLFSLKFSHDLNFYRFQQFLQFQLSPYQTCFFGVVSKFSISYGLIPSITDCFSVLSHLEHAQLFYVFSDVLLHKFSLFYKQRLMKTLHQNVLCPNFHCISTNQLSGSISHVHHSSTEPDMLEDIHAKLHESRVVWGLLERGQGGLPQEHVHNSQLFCLTHGLI